MDLKASRHVVIAISGWLSKDANHEKDWNAICEYLKDSSVVVFGVNWDAKKIIDLAIPAAQVLAGIAASLFIRNPYIKATVGACSVGIGVA